MSGTAIVLVVIGIFLLAALLIAVPRALARRDTGPEPELRERPAPPTRPPARPPAPPPPVVTPVPTEEEVGEVLEEAERLLEAPPTAEAVEAPEAPPTEPPATEEAVEELEVVEAPRLRDRLSRMRAAFSGLRRGGDLTDESWDELEETLLLADAGMATTQRILEGVRARAAAGKVREASALPELLREELVAQLDGDGDGATRRELHVESGEPNVWMFVGVNGVGKTTTVAKIARREQAEGHRVLLAAADTFRAAAAEQLGTWADRLGVELVRGQEGADPGSVVFDAMDAAASRGADLVLVDTAGRLHTKVNLMEELKKLRRIVDRRPGALREVLLVLDATTGQNGLTQAREFTDAVEVTGVVLTKLDGTAKGGVVLAIEHELGVPVKLVGVGEGADDLIPFDPDEFAAALVS
jgi:fused signal recognition particle receptor